MEPKIEINEACVEQIIVKLLGEKPSTINRINNGLSNFVYEVVMESRDDLIVRISPVPQQLNVYLKEQWCAARARELGVPAPDILEVGNELIGYPYMVTRKEIGIDGNKFPDRRKVLSQLAHFNAVINTIDTQSFGGVFDWSNNTLSKNDNWKDYLYKEFEIEWRMEVFRKYKVLEKQNMLQLEKGVNALMSLKDPKPRLNHGDMRLKNVLVNEEGDIVALLDWENSVSTITPHWDLSIALHDLTIDEKNEYLKSYGMAPRDFKKISKLMKTFNILNYAPSAMHRIERDELNELEFIKLRLNRYFDMFAL